MFLLLQLLNLSKILMAMQLKIYIQVIVNSHQRIVRFVTKIRNKSWLMITSNLIDQEIYFHNNCVQKTLQILLKSLLKVIKYHNCKQQLQQLYNHLYQLLVIWKKSLNQSAFHVFTYHMMKVLKSSSFTFMGMQRILVWHLIYFFNLVMKCKCIFLQLNILDMGSIKLVLQLKHR